MKQLVLIFSVILLFASCSGLKPTMAGSFTDSRDGKVYRWVKLKDQIWMAQNLDYVTDGAEYVSNSKEQRIIGRTYFGSFVTDNLAPKGWHIPSDDEWQKLEVASGMPKSLAERTLYRGDNEADFLEGGCMKFNVLFTGHSNHQTPGTRTFYEFVYFWSSTKVLKSLMTRSFRTNDNRIGKNMLGIAHTAYIRCLKNDTTTTGLVVDYIKPVKKKK